MERYDLLIIGAGWHGLSMAKTYKEACPEANITILDSSSSIGGTWAMERLYPGLKTNNIVGSFEFSDYPLILAKYGMKPGQHIPGPVVHQYLSDFAEEYGLAETIRFRTKVDSATVLETGEWEVEFRTTAEDDSEKTTQSGKLIASKMVLATGLTSEPFMPHFRGQDGFKGNIMHSKQLKTRAETLAGSKTVVVIGGNKSAWDVCYSVARSGATAHMVMRPSGGGPSWVWPTSITFGVIRTSLSRLSSTRLFTWFDPAPFANAGEVVRGFLHRTLAGRWVCSCFWKYLDYSIKSANGYNDGDAMRKLTPWTSTFWMGNSLSIHNYETNWFDLVKQGRIIPHIANVTSITENTVHLSDNSSVEADTIVCCTGWTPFPTLNFHPEGLAAEIGLPSLISKHDSVINEMAKAQTLRKTPSLARKPLRTLSVLCEGPREHEKSEHSAISPYCLYRFLIPTSPFFLQHRNFAVLGAHLSIHALMVAQAQALWVTAFFQDKVPHLHTECIDYESLEYEAIQLTEYEKLRRPAEAGGSGARYPDLVFDSLPYIDQLLNDLGVRARRKAGWLKEFIEPYGLKDYQGLVKEWLKLVGR